MENEMNLGQPLAQLEWKRERGTYSGSEMLKILRHSYQFERVWWRAFFLALAAPMVALAVFSDSIPAQLNIRFLRLLIVAIGVLGIVFFCIGLPAKGSLLGTRRQVKRQLESESTSGGRVVLYEDCMVVRHMGDDETIPYNLIKMKETEYDTLLTDLRLNPWLLTAIPSNVLRSSGEFCAILTKRAGTESLPFGTAETSDKPETARLHPADLTAGRVLITARYGEHIVTVMRKKGLTELIIDGSVYAEYRKVFEKSYTLSAVVGGLEYTFVNQVNFSNCVIGIIIGGQLAAKRLRAF